MVARSVGNVLYWIVHPSTTNSTWYTKGKRCNHI